MSEQTSRSGNGQCPGVRVSNSSGYPGVSWHKAARKWGAYIRRHGVRTYLGLFATAEAAHQAYRQADILLTPEPTPAEEQIAALVEEARQRVAISGIEALYVRALAKGGLRARMGTLRLDQAELIARLGLTEAYASHRSDQFTYRGVRKPRWTWERAVTVARDLACAEGDLPTIPWCRLNGHSHLVNVVFDEGRTWEELRVELGLPASPRFFPSRSGRRWRSRPEACLSNFLHARGVQHKRGEAYPEGYAAASGRARGHFDLHFRAMDGRWIDVEVWGNLGGGRFGSRYAETRAAKETWNRNNPDFLGIDHERCFSDVTLAEDLRPYIGDLDPHRGATPVEQNIETAHWSNVDELIASCRAICASVPDGRFPAEDWLRKRGRHAGRSGPAYNTLAVYVQRWCGGTRGVRKLLGQSEASTTKWDESEVKRQWEVFTAAWGSTPAWAISRKGSGSLDPAAKREGRRIYDAARRLNVTDQALALRSGRRRSWSPERIIAEWEAFKMETGRRPSECLSHAQRKTLPKPLCDRAARVYNAAQRNGLLMRLQGHV